MDSQIEQVHRRVSFNVDCAPPPQVPQGPPYKFPDPVEVVFPFVAKLESLGQKTDEILIQTSFSGNEWEDVKKLNSHLTLSHTTIERIHQLIKSPDARIDHVFAIFELLSRQLLETNRAAPRAAKTLEGRRSNESKIFGEIHDDLTEMLESVLDYHDLLRELDELADRILAERDVAKKTIDFNDGINTNNAINASGNTQIEAVNYCQVDTDNRTCATTGPGDVDAEDEYGFGSDSDFDDVDDDEANRIYLASHVTRQVIGLFTAINDEPKSMLPTPMLAPLGAITSMPATQIFVAWRRPSIEFTPELPSTAPLAELCKRSKRYRLKFALRLVMHAARRRARKPKDGIY